MPDVTRGGTKRVSLVEIVDRVLNKGAVIAGDVTIAVADIDLIRLGLQVVLASVETLNAITEREVEQQAQPAPQ